MTICERIKTITDKALLNRDIFGNVHSPGDSFLLSKKPYIINSISGGRSSGVMAWILENCPIYDKYEKIHVFMNTGREDVRTIQFLKNIQDHVINKPIHIIEAKVYHDERKGSGYTLKDFDTLSMNGEPFEEVIKKYGLPSIDYIHCSRELKINPINAFISEGLGLSKEQYRQAIGIRLDEVRRYKNNPDNFIYPLIDFHFRKKHVNQFWTEDFPLYDIGPDWEDFEGNCDFCFKKSGENLVKNYTKNPSKIGWWLDMESKYYNGYPIYRHHKQAQDIIDGNMEEDQELECLCGNGQLTFFE